MWAIALHGGAGIIPRPSSSDEAGVRRYKDIVVSLQQALDIGRAALAAGDTAVSVVEKVVIFLEECEHFNAGKGAVFTAAGKHSLDASIMNGAGRQCGATAAVTTVRNPISLARKIMERTEHVMLVGAGAEEFAATQQLELVPNSWFDTQYRRSKWEELLQQSKHGTVGCVCLDTKGNLAAGTSTGGMTGCKFGRVGDSPIIGAGTWADNRTCAVSCTGHGEKFIRNGIAHEVSSILEYVPGMTLQNAAHRAVFQRLESGDGGLISVSPRGEVAMVFNDGGMFRAAADSHGLQQVGIWEEFEECLAPKGGPNDISTQSRLPATGL
jgi:beta-aspartyl-peptidase (threonine type)